MAGASPFIYLPLLIAAGAAAVTADAQQPAPSAAPSSRLLPAFSLDSLAPLASLSSLTALLRNPLSTSFQPKEKESRSAAPPALGPLRLPPVLSLDAIPSLSSLVALAGPLGAGDGASRLQQAEQRARGALRLVSKEARSALSESVQALHNAAAAAPPASAAAASAAVDASANLIELLDEVRRVARTTLENANGPQAVKAARQCGDEAVSRAERALRAAVDALGRCVSVATAAEQEAARRLTALVQEAERRAAEAATGVALAGCLNVTRLKAALDCLTRQVLSARAEVAGRAEAGVRGARALGGDAAQAESSALGCVQRQVEAARVQAAALASWVQGCAAAAQAAADLLPPFESNTKSSTTPPAA